VAEALTAIEIMREVLYQQLDNGERALVERALIQAQAEVTSFMCRDCRQEYKSWSQARD
jgi:hypothetical protein